MSLVRRCPANSRTCVHWCTVLLAVVALLTGCAQKELRSASRSSAAPAEGTPEPPAAAAPYRYTETGIASWYGKEFQGKRTASGEMFDMYAFTAAHRTLPLGAIIQVTDQNNLKSVNVRVNDRGPFIRDRILELSYAAARELGFAGHGTAHITIETLEEPQQRTVYTVQAAVFAEEENAKLLKDRLSKKYEVITIVPFESSLGTFYRVRVGSYATEEKAELVAGKLKLEGLEPFVVRKDEIPRTN